MGPVRSWDPRTVKAFGVISYNGVGPLVQYDGTVDAISILQTNLRPEYNNLRGTRSRESKRTYFHDQASAHKADLTKSWFNGSKVHDVLLPSKSYDINIIETCWSILKDELFKRNKRLQSKEDLWE